MLSIKSTQVSIKKYESFEHSITKISSPKGKSIFLITIYRLQDKRISLFFEEFPNLLEEYTVLNDLFVISGDINIHMESDEPSSKKMHDILDVFNLTQHVHEPTHIKGHTIDVVITSKQESLINNLKVTPFDLSHHFLVDFSFTTQVKCIPKLKSISFRPIRNVNMERFREDVENGFKRHHSTQEFCQYQYKITIMYYMK